MRHDFMIVDVFTDVAFGGNQLAVLTDARDLTGAAMQTITREFDFPETAFVLPAENPANSRRVRIFTAGNEMQFAGHPTVGTACVLVMSGQCAPGEIVLEEGVGPVPVTIRQDGGSLSARFRLDRPPEVPQAIPSVADMAAILSLEPDDIADIFCAGMGVNFTFVRVGSRELVDRSRLDQPAWERLLADELGAQVHVFAGELTDGAELYARMYGPKFGIPEDPATGAAAAALVGAAALRAGSSLRIDIVQGVKMGRPSRIEASANVAAGELRFVEVGGGCVFVAQGQIEVPEHFL